MVPLIDETLICFDVKADSKEDIIAQLADRMNAAGRLTDRDGYIAAVLEREKHFSTGVGFSIATPHAKTDAVSVPSMAFARLDREIVWDEEENARFIFQIAVPEKDKGNRHLEILAQLSRKLMHEDFRESIEQIGNAADFIRLLGIE